MDIFSEEWSVNLIAHSLLELSQARKFNRSVLTSEEINKSCLCNVTADFDHTTNCPCEGNLTTSLFPILHEKNWPALLTIIVIIITIFGNILVILAVSLEKKLHNATNYFLMSLAITDMLLGFLVMPISMLTILYEYRWPLPRNLCTVWIYFDVLFSTASIMHLCAISLDRYIAIQDPIHHSRFNSRTKALAKIALVWTVSIGISMPVLIFGFHDNSKVFKNGSCFLVEEKFVLIGSFVAFFIPLVIMVITYFLTIKSLQKEATSCMNDLDSKPGSFKFFPQSSLSLDKHFTHSLNKESGTFKRRKMQSISNEQKASKVLGIVFFLFVVMWCPFFITNVMIAFCKEACYKDVIEDLLNIFVWIGYLSSAVNPLIYTLFSKTYRSAFVRYLQCHYKEKKKPLQSFLVNTIPTVVYNSHQLTQMKCLRKESKLMATGTSEIHDLDETLKSKVSNMNEKVSCL
ncbi:PREDICTED: 5-hydroxytryptamine receptor 2A [Thamnophis sirtalis]|uniref:5-hydroxytryptamine receptor 2A n=1 Tax=Thamnophis sirtalis TaxID=35019 RepID=A0A6I9Y7I6_9SAUR|nr:PREDICTED: 5-hydroxytryptamine receptor 2A [Thamnophis sirtalis]